MRRGLIMIDTVSRLYLLDAQIRSPPWLPFLRHLTKIVWARAQRSPDCAHRGTES